MDEVTALKVWSDFYYTVENEVVCPVCKETIHQELGYEVTFTGEVCHPWCEDKIVEVG